MDRYNRHLLVTVGNGKPNNKMRIPNKAVQAILTPASAAPDTTHACIACSTLLTPVSPAPDDWRGPCSLVLAQPALACSAELPSSGALWSSLHLPGDLPSASAHLLPAARYNKVYYCTTRYNTAHTEPEGRYTNNSARFTK